MYVRPPIVAADHPCVKADEKYEDRLAAGDLDDSEDKFLSSGDPF
jgi:hypothetical protein